jgi:[protein-PII] uridylyltransferase
MRLAPGEASKIRRNNLGGGAARVSEQDLKRIWTGACRPEDIENRIRRRPAWAIKRVPPVKTEVTVTNDASSRFTVVDVLTRDRLGLLHILARTLYREGLSIALSKIHTEGARALDVFYVEEADTKVLDPNRLERIGRALTTALDDFHSRMEEGR